MSIRKHFLPAASTALALSTAAAAFGQTKPYEPKDIQACPGLSPYATRVFSPEANRVFKELKSNQGEEITVGTHKVTFMPGDSFPDICSRLASADPDLKRFEHDQIREHKIERKEEARVQRLERQAEKEDQEFLDGYDDKSHPEIYRWHKVGEAVGNVGRDIVMPWRIFHHHKNHG